MKYLIILSMLFSPLVYAHDRDSQPVVPVTGHNDNHNNSQDTAKEVILGVGLGLLGFAILYHPKGTNDVKEGREEIKFRVGTHEPAK